MANAVNLKEGIGRKELQTICRRYIGLHRQRLRLIEEELHSNQMEFLELLPLLFHINHPTLPGFVNTRTPAGIPDFTPSQSVLRTARKLSRSFHYKKRARRHYHISGLYLMGSLGSIGHTAVSDFDVWLCHDPQLQPKELERLRSKSDRIELWAKEYGLEVHIFLVNTERFRLGDRDSLSQESSGSTQPLMLLEEFYRTGLLLAGRYPLWWLVPPEEEKNYAQYTEMLIHKRFVNPHDCIDFGGLDELQAEEFFGAAHWQLYKGVGSPYKAILKLLLTEAYAQDYPDIRWLCEESKRAIYAGRIEIAELDPYVLMYLRVEQYLKRRDEQGRLDLARRCFYFKTEQALSLDQHRNQPAWKRELLSTLVTEWGWGQAYLILLDTRENWKIDRVQEERNILVQELSKSYELLTEFARNYASRGQIDPKELNLLERKLHTTLEKRPGKIDNINPGISRDLAEKSVSLHYNNTKGERSSGWSLYLGEVDNEQALIANPIKTTQGLLELLTWSYFNRVISHNTVIAIFPKESPVGIVELHALLRVIANLYPDRATPSTPAEDFSSPPFALKCALFINTGKDPMANLTKVGMQLTSNRSDPLSFGAAHHSLVMTIEQLITTSWGETLVLIHGSTTGLLECLCHYLRLTLLAHPLLPSPKVSAHSFSSIRATSIARRVEELFNDVCQGFGPDGAGLESRYLLQADDEYYLIQRQQEHFTFVSIENYEALIELLAQPQTSFHPVLIDAMALKDTPLPAIYRINRNSTIQIFYLHQKGRTKLYLLDEQGTLHFQEMKQSDDQYLLTQLQRFLNGVRLLRNLYIEPPAHQRQQDEPEFHYISHSRNGLFYTEQKKPPRHKLAENYMELRIICERLDLARSPYMLICGDREFSSLEYGATLFRSVAEYIIEKRQNNQAYPIYLTGITLSNTVGGDECSTARLFNFKKRVERKLNQARLTKAVETKDKLATQ